LHSLKARRGEPTEDTAVPTTAGPRPDSMDFLDDLEDLLRQGLALTRRLRSTVSADPGPLVPDLPHFPSGERARRLLEVMDALVEDRPDKRASIEELLAEAQAQGMSIDDAQDGLETLRRGYALYCPVPGQLMRLDRTTPGWRSSC